MCTETNKSSEQAGDERLRIVRHKSISVQYCHRLFSLEGHTDRVEDLLEFLLRVNVAHAVLLGMDQLTVDGHLQRTGRAGSLLAGEVDGPCSLEVFIQLLLQLIHLRLVPSSTTVDDVDIDFSGRHDYVRAFKLFDQALTEHTKVRPHCETH